jgi:ABC-2 type transport system permease protein
VTVSSPGGDAVVALHAVTRVFAPAGQRVVALDAVTAGVAGGRVTGLVGPDGAGKTTWLRLCAGLLVPDTGTLRVLGEDPVRDVVRLRPRVGYMPQRFGLYEDLTVAENLDLYADLHGVPSDARRERVGDLLAATGLARFTDRLAGRLSGGMKQKLGLACVLVHPPELLLLDEPTVGVDPVSRRELWRIIGEQLASGTSVLLSTAYFDEAERCDEVLLVHRGQVLDRGPPGDFRARMAGRTFAFRTTGPDARPLRERAAALPGVLDAAVQGGQVRVLTERSQPPPALAADDGARLTPEPVTPRFEDAFLALLAERREPVAAGAALAAEAAARGGAGAVIELEAVRRRFGAFEAVRGVSLRVARGEVYGLIGPNGAGKSTIIKMLCGLLAPTEGEARVLGLDLAHAPAEVRARVGYMSQRFSLYRQVSAQQNLEFFAGAYGLAGAARRARIEALLETFALGPYRDRTAEDLPLGFKQRLALACALLHRPEILFLDEPTSGVDPLARREFWQRINTLAAGGVTVLVTTHFLEEAEYCDRVAIVHEGVIAAEETPRELKARLAGPGNPDPSLEEVFVSLIEPRARAESERGKDSPQRTQRAQREENAPGGHPVLSSLRGSPVDGRSEGKGAGGRRVLALVRKESLQAVRDPSSIAIAFLLPLVLLFLFGYGVSLDARGVPVALVVESPSHDTAAFTGHFARSQYFDPRPMGDLREAEAALLRGEVRAIVRLRGDFSRRVHRGDGTRIQLLVDGVDANTARLVQGYVQGVWQAWLTQEEAEAGRELRAPVQVEHRVWFNPEVNSRYFLVPGLIAIVMTLIGALLTAVVVAREWERGTMEALLATPARAGEILLSKVVPYFLLGLGGLGLSVAMAVGLFGVPLVGSFWVLLVCSGLFLLAALGMGLLISTVTRTQFTAAQIAMLATFLPAFILSGFIFDLGSMPAPVEVLTHLVAARYFVAILHTVFLAGDVWSVIVPNSAALALMAAVFLGLTRRVTRTRLE